MEGEKTGGLEDKIYEEQGTKNKESKGQINCSRIQTG